MKQSDMENKEANEEMIFNIEQNKALKDAVEKFLANEKKNEPLTLEELRQMDGEPVWVVPTSGDKPLWGIVDTDKSTGWFCVVVGTNSFYTSKFYGSGEMFGWLAYRRKKNEDD